ncbi:MAG: HD domain-containing protein [Desulfobacteraceae bacterium]|nr:HD domain-containing protein [Desulfobacteraceae bacterium]
MTDDDYKALADFFEDYTKGFIFRAVNAHAIGLKKEHTARVVENMVFLGECLGLSRSSMRLAKATALLHDIGRFSQYEIYGTYSDLASKNHGAMGVGVIREHRLLASCPKVEKKQIIRAIALHNIYQLPPGIDTDTLFLTRLLRDADKLDILWVMTQKYLGTDTEENGYITLNLPDDGLVSKELVARILKKQLIDTRQVRSLNDLKLLQISWVFDLNFKAAVKQVDDRCFIPRIISTMPDSELLASLVDFIKAHMVR